MTLGPRSRALLAALLLSSGCHGALLPTLTLSGRGRFDLAHGLRRSLDATLTLSFALDRGATAPAAVSEELDALSELERARCAPSDGLCLATRALAERALEDARALEGRDHEDTENTP